MTEVSIEQQETTKLGPYTIQMNEQQRALIEKGLLCLIDDFTKTKKMSDVELEVLSTLYSLFEQLPKEFRSDVEREGYAKTRQMLYGFCL